MSTRSQLTKDLHENVRTLLGRHTKILVKYMVKLETKTDKFENRVLVFTPLRVYLLYAKVPTKADTNFHYLDIAAVESKNHSHFAIVTNDRTYSFSTTGDAGSFSSSADVVLTDLVSAVKQIFPTVPLRYIIRRIDVQPADREQIFSDELRPSDPRNVGPCGGFSLQYACMCDLHNVTYREEIAWDIDTIYLSHDTRVLNLRDFDHLDSKDLMALVSALEYNTFFRGLKVTHARLSHETLERVLHVLRRSLWLEELHLEALGLRADFLHKLAVAVISNSSPALQTITLSHNLIEDKGAVHLAGPIAKISKGLCKLSLAQCGLTAKGVNQIAHSLSLNQSISSSLTHLDLSGNNLKDEINNLYNFLAQPNILEHLDISMTDTLLENLFGALLRGCSTHLVHLNVSHNSFSTKKGKEIPPSFKQFFTSSLSLKHLNIASCKLPLEALKNLLLGLACNESTADIHLDLSGNALGAQGAHVLESCIHGVRVLQSLDIGDNNLDVELASVLTAVSKNPSIRSLFLVRSFAGMKLKHIGTVMDALVALIQKDDFPLTELVLAENKLKHDLHDFINALGSNQHLQRLDITGNLIGDIGARLLAKALQINSKLRTIHMDRNAITLQGYSDLVYALESNHAMRNIPFPVFDVQPCMKNHPERTDAVMRKMQECLQRNALGVKRTSAQNFRLQHGLLLSSTHQLVDKLVAETQETMSLCTTGGTDTGGQPVPSESAVQRLIDDAENSKQLLPKLQECLRYAEQHPIELKLQRVQTDVAEAIAEYLRETMESMLRAGVEQCPKTLGLQSVVSDLRRRCTDRLQIPDEFLRTALIHTAGGEIMCKLSEIEQSLATLISDRATDEVLDALTRYRRGLGIADTPSVQLGKPRSAESGKSSGAATPGIDPSGRHSETSQRKPATGAGKTSKTFGNNEELDRFELDSPTKLEYLNLATPILQNKRSRTFAHKIRPQSVVENLSLSHLPTLLDSPNASRRGSATTANGGAASAGNGSTPAATPVSSANAKRLASQSGGSLSTTATPRDRRDTIDDDEEDELGNCDSITELPSASFQLQHLVKGRPKRTKTRAPTRVALVSGGGDPAATAGVAVGEGLETFFGAAGSLTPTPTTLTPLISPTSDECSSLSFVDSPTLSRGGDDTNGRPWISSEETTPVLEDRKPLAGTKPLTFAQSSPLLKGVAWTPRSISSDHLERYAPAASVTSRETKSPLLKVASVASASLPSAAAAAHTRTTASASQSVGGAAEQPQRVRVSAKIFNHKNARTPSNESIKSVEADLMLSLKTGESRTPVLPPKPRPWSVAGNEGKCEFAAGGGSPASGLTTPEALDATDVVLIEGPEGGSIVGITPGAALGGGSIVGITPGAALEKKTVRDIAAGLNRIGNEVS